MFSHLKNIIDIVVGGTKSYSNYSSQQDRKKSISEMLQTYFLIKDCADEGKRLILDAGEDPINKIKLMDSESSIATLSNWDLALRKQGFRLHILQDLILGQDHLVVIDPDLKEQISSVIGSKMDRVLTLHGIGASLYLNAMFPITDSVEETKNLITLMSGTEGDAINFDTSMKEIEALNKSLNSYREVINQLTSKEEILSLSKAARDETNFDDI